MTVDIEEAINNFSNNRSELNLKTLEVSLVLGEVLVPVSSAGPQDRSGTHVLPLICYTDSYGYSVLPSFTSEEHLREWKKDGSRFVILNGGILIEMVRRIQKIDLIAVNPFGSPRGVIPREDFDRLLAIYDLRDSSET